jgi:hypothetical protein
VTKIKKCLDCGIEISNTNSNRCNNCRNLHNKEYQNKYRVDWNIINKKKRKRYNKEYFKKVVSNLTDKEKIKFKERASGYNKKYYKKKMGYSLTEEKIKLTPKESRHKTYLKRKISGKVQESKRIYMANIQHRISLNLRVRLWSALKRNKRNTVKYYKFNEYIGCSLESLVLHIESKFSEGMSWGNYKIDGWHIDHILPCDSFDLTKPDEQLRCFHYTNLQPMWAADNIKKSNKLIS